MHRHRRYLWRCVRRSALPLRTRCARFGGRNKIDNINRIIPLTAAASLQLHARNAGRFASYWRLLQRYSDVYDGEAVDCDAYCQSVHKNSLRVDSLRLLL